MVQDDLEIMNITYDELRKIKVAILEVSEDIVLRTRTVSAQEPLSEKEQWDDAIRGELKQLFDEKETLVRLATRPRML